MKKTTLILIAGLLANALAQAETYPVLTVNGQSYKKCTVKKFGDAYALLDFDGGGAKVLLSDLPANVQKDVGYDALAASMALTADSAAKTDKEKKKLEAWRAANCRMLNGEVLQKRDLVFITGSVHTITSEGVLINPLIPRTNILAPRTIPVPNEPGSRASIGGIMLSGRPTEIPGSIHVHMVPSRQTVFVVCPTSELIDGQAVEFWAKRDGMYTYEQIPGRPTPNPMLIGTRLERYVATTPYISPP